MKATRFGHFFENENNAHRAMVRMNRSYIQAGNKVDVACLVEGPEDNWAVVDIRTAIELGSRYEWSV